MDAPEDRSKALNEYMSSGFAPRADIVAACRHVRFVPRGDAKPIKDWSLTTMKGQADQDRREGSEPRPLCYLPDGRGRHRTANVPRDFAAHRGAAAAATTSASV